MSTTELGYRRLEMSRRRVVLTLLGALAFTVFGVFMMGHGAFLPGLLSVAFFGGGGIRALPAIRTAPVIVLDAGGVTFVNRNIPSWHGWSNVSAFTVVAVGRTKIVVFDRLDLTAEALSSPLVRASIAMSGFNSDLGAGYGGLSAVDLADLLNRYRDAYGSLGPADVGAT